MLYPHSLYRSNNSLSFSAAESHMYVDLETPSAAFVCSILAHNNQGLMQRTLEVNMSR